MSNQRTKDEAAGAAHARIMDAHSSEVRSLEAALRSLVAEANHALLRLEQAKLGAALVAAKSTTDAADRVTLITLRIGMLRELGAEDGAWRLPGRS